MNRTGIEKLGKEIQKSPHQGVQTLNPEVIHLE